MPLNLLGNYIRERRQDLGLTQEELAARIGGTASQAEISRLERGTIQFPRRSRLDALAGALDVSLGTLLMESGWMTGDEGTSLDALPSPPTPHDLIDTEGMLTEVEQLRATLLTAIERVNALEALINAGGGRPKVNLPTGVVDDCETSEVFTA